MKNPPKELSKVNKVRQGVLQDVEVLQKRLDTTIQHWNNAYRGVDDKIDSFALVLEAITRILDPESHSDPEKGLIFRTVRDIRLERMEAQVQETESVIQEQIKANIIKQTDGPPSENALVVTKHFAKDGTQLNPSLVHVNFSGFSQDLRDKLLTAKVGDTVDGPQEQKILFVACYEPVVQPEG